MKRSLDRRSFLKRAALTAPCLLAAARAGAARVRARPKKILVVGAGLAGLSAAYELTRAGHDVTVLEAQTRPGGRVQTLRDPFPDGLYAEAGATNVFDNHHWTLKYLREFALELDQFKPSNLATLYHVRGRRMVVRPGQNVDWPFELRPDERASGRRGIWEKYVSAALKELGDPEAAGWPHPSLAEYDRVTFTDFLRRRGASEGAVALLRLGVADHLGEGADAVSALNLLREFLHRERRKQGFTVRGGTDLLPKAFAARLGEKIRYGAHVVRIEHGPRGVRARFRQAGATHKTEAEYLVCAVPFTLLRRMEITPPFSPAKRSAVEQLGYTSVTRVFLQTRRRFWLEEGLTGAATTDLPVSGVYDKTFNQPGSRGLLESYQSGRHARRTAALGEAERLSATLEGVAALLPSVKQNYEGGSSKCWDQDEWARGAYAWFKPGQMASLMPHVSSPEGRVHFAGDHASSLPGWMHGALESGNRVAREIDQTPP